MTKELLIEFYEEEINEINQSIIEMSKKGIHAHVIDIYGLKTRKIDCEEFINNLKKLK